VEEQVASKDKLRVQISELIKRPQNVDYEELVGILNQLGARSRRARHGVIFKIPGCADTLMLNEHNDGKPHLPGYCIRQFRKCMIELGLYDQE
jgi:hypothetical protein